MSKFAGRARNEAMLEVDLSLGPDVKTLLQQELSAFIDTLLLDPLPPDAAMVRLHIRLTAHPTLELTPL